MNQAEPAWVADKRDAKASKVVQWLIDANSAHRRCRRCYERIERDADQRWVSKTTFGTTMSDCQAPGFRRLGASVAHVPETWTEQLVAAATQDQRTRERVSELAGLERPCSERTWERVVVLYAARLKKLRGE